MPTGKRFYVAVGVLVLSIVLVALLWRRHERPEVLRLATGAESGTFYPLGKTLAKSFARGAEPVDLKVLATSGSGANLAMLEKHEADLALVANSVPGNASTTLVAPLFAEAVQVVVRKYAHIETPNDLVKRRVAIGPAGSGTETVALIILKHFGIARADFDARNMTPSDGTAALENGQIDALFLVARLGDPTVDGVVNSVRHPGTSSLLSLGDPYAQGSALAGIRLGAPFLQPTVIPERTYGAEPAKALGTVSMEALLVARTDLDEDLVASLTAALYADKVRLATEDVQFARLSERFDPADSPYPLHPGADRYYRRDDPSFIAKNADQISLGLTVGAILWSGATALTAFRRRRRSNRVEEGHQELASLAFRSRAATTAVELKALRAEVEHLREQIFAELAHKRLEGTPDVMILQRRIDGQLADLDRRVAELPA